ncbi:DUF3016 domain-containing protein [Massilia sp. YIM B02763]|uniref:DUF3016 domain-containing protein n=1 Tax=Massilia sp. YIM B02763 TaxID=3050130 RepID=UPI002806577A|nr:DUF3016 domain-containing protein [Massilia sp. YIM B02763]
MTMKSFMKRAALAGVLALGASSAFADVTVTYVKPETFYDLPFATWERDELLQQITDHFVELGKSLPPGQNLRIEVTDFDPAGRLYPNARAGKDIRVVKGMADWPRMDLHYTLEQDGQVLKSGDAKLSDMNYQQNFNRYFDTEPLRYEKRMIDVWFDKEIAPLKDRRGLAGR